VLYALLLNLDELPGGSLDDHASPFDPGDVLEISEIILSLLNEGPEFSGRSGTKDGESQ
jgi:hypothetical protein